MVVPGRGGWERWQSRETSIRERLRDTAELGFHIGPSEKEQTLIKSLNFSTFSLRPK